MVNSTTRNELSLLLKILVIKSTVFDQPFQKKSANAFFLFASTMVVTNLRQLLRTM